MAIRQGDYKLIVGQFARCGRDPMASEIAQRMAGTQRGAELSWLLQCLMQLHPGYPELYTPVLQALAQLPQLTQRTSLPEHVQSFGLSSGSFDAGWQHARSGGDRQA